MGSLDTIEKYEIEFDKWRIISVKLTVPIHDLASFYLGKSRVLLLGGNNDDGPSSTVEVKDLSAETSKLKLKNGGK